MILFLITLFILLQAYVTIEIVRGVRDEGFRRFFSTWKDYAAAAYVALGWFMTWVVADPAVVYAIRAGVGP